MKSTTFEKMKKDLLKTLEEKEHHSDIFKAVGVDMDEEKKEKLNSDIMDHILSSGKRTDSIKEALKRAQNLNEFAVFLLVYVSSGEKAETLAKKMLDALTK